MDVLITLQKAREIITPEDKWCTRSRHSAAGAFCALGAIDQALGELGKDVGLYGSSDCTPEVVALNAAIPSDAKKAIEDGHRSDNWNTRPNERISKDRNATKVAVYNNTSDHKTVLAWFDRTIELQKEHPMEKA